MRHPLEIVGIGAVLINEDRNAVRRVRILPGAAGALDVRDLGNKAVAHRGAWGRELSLHQGGSALCYWSERARPEIEQLERW